MHIWHHSLYYWTMRVSWSANDQWHDRWGDVVTQCSSSNIEWLSYPKLGDDECSTNVDTHHLIDDADCKMLLQSYFIQLQEYLAIDTWCTIWFVANITTWCSLSFWYIRRRRLIHTMSIVMFLTIDMTCFNRSQRDTAEQTWFLSVCSYFWKYLRIKFLEVLIEYQIRVKLHLNNGSIS